MEIDKMALELVEELNDAFVTENQWGYLPYGFESYGWQNSRITFMGVGIWNDSDSGDIAEGNRVAFKNHILDESMKVFMNLELSFKSRFKGIR